MFKDLVCQFFSSKSQLMSLRVHIPCDKLLIEIYQCLFWSTDRCRTLRYLHVRLYNKRVLELFIEHAPNLERLSVYFEKSWVRSDFVDSSNDKSRKSYQRCSKKVGQSHYLI